MSRIIRSLETRDRPLIACRINPHDKRKINVALTPEGIAAFQDYQSARLGGIGNLLNKLSEEDLEDLQRLLSKLHEVVGPPAI
jgi:DNA-binding MarR family transcriptional regulator